MHKVVLRKIFLGALLAAALAFLLFINLDFIESRIIDEVCEFGHLPLFGVVALVFLRLFNTGKRPWARPWPYVLSFFAAAVTSVVTEVLQGFTPGRHFALNDILYNSLGAFTFLALAYPLKQYSKKGTGETVTKTSRGKAGGIMRLKAACLGIILLATVPLQLAVVDTQRMNRDFPLLGSFENRLEAMRWESESTTFKRVKSHASHGQFALKVPLAPGEFPGVSLVQMKNDWRGHDRLMFDAWLEGSTTLRVVVRIHDRAHDQTYADRFNQRFVLAPGANILSIDLDKVREAPHGRVMDMSRIVNVCVFSYRLKEPRTLYLDNFRLSPGGVRF